MVGQLTKDTERLRTRKRLLIITQKCFGHVFRFQAAVRSQGVVVLFDILLR